MDKNTVEKITLKSYAKINLSLEVLGLLDNGYHQVEMVMQQVELHDLVTVGWTAAESLFMADGDAADGFQQSDEAGGFQQSDEAKGQKYRKIELTSGRDDLPVDNGNIAYRAAVLMMETLNKSGLVNIDIQKNIPVAAGLAGGSGNAAAVIHALNHIWNSGLAVDELCKIGVKLGADVPFCIMGQAAGNDVLRTEIREHRLACTCALAEGIGEELTPIQPLDCWVLLSKPPIGVSTQEVYKGIDKELGLGMNNAQSRRYIDTNLLIEGLKEKNYGKIFENMANTLEIFSLKRYPIIVYTKDMIKQEQKCLKVMMSGSGPTVFSLYLEKEDIEADYCKLYKYNAETYITKTLI